MPCILDHDWRFSIVFHDCESALGIVALSHCYNSGQAIMNIDGNASGVCRPFVVFCALIPNATYVIPNRALWVERHYALQHFIVYALNDFKTAAKRIEGFLVHPEVG